MFVLILVHGSLPEENEYYGPFDSETAAYEYTKRLIAEGRNVGDHTVESLGSPSL